MINISNCPISGLKRKLKKRFHWKEDMREISIECFISHFDENDQLVENARIKSYVRNLVASDSYVDVTNGKVLSKEELNQREIDLFNIANFTQIHNQWKLSHDAWLVNNHGLPEPIEPVLPQTPNNIMLEYDYYAYVLGTTPIILPNLINRIIQLRDLEGKFNI